MNDQKLAELSKKTCAIYFMGRHDAFVDIVKNGKEVMERAAGVGVTERELAVMKSFLDAVQASADKLAKANG